jgi:DNA-binding transcriptional LysR family regulator
LGGSGVHRQLTAPSLLISVDLIQAGSRPLRLTEVGRLLYEQAIRVLERIAASSSTIPKLHFRPRSQ